MDIVEGKVRVFLFLWRWERWMVGGEEGRNADGTIPLR